MTTGWCPCRMASASVELIYLDKLTAQFLAPTNLPVLNAQFARVDMALQVSARSKDCCELGAVARESQVHAAHASYRPHIVLKLPGSVDILV
jgi:hypothetical protein